MQLADNLGVALGAGAGGAAVAGGQAAGWTVGAGVRIAFFTAATAAVVGVVLAGRLPGRSVHAPDTGTQRAPLVT
jgi:hypothetical protein